MCEHEGIGPLSPGRHEVARTEGNGHSRIGPDAAARNAPEVAGPVQDTWGNQLEAAPGHAVGLSKPVWPPPLRPFGTQGHDIVARAHPGRGATYGLDRTPEPEADQIEHRLQDRP